MDPAPFSLRELVWMAEHHQSTQWNHTSLIVATVLNARLGVKRQHLVKPQRIHPYHRRQRRKAVSGDDAERILSKTLGTPGRT